MPRPGPLICLAATGVDYGTRFRPLTTSASLRSTWITGPGPRGSAGPGVGEDAVPPPRRKGARLPDVVVLDGAGQTLLAVEFGGSYTAARVASFHKDCEARGCPMCFGEP